MSTGMFQWLEARNDLNEVRDSVAVCNVSAFAPANPVRMDQMGWTDLCTNGQGKLRKGRPMVFHLPLVGEVFREAWIRVSLLMSEAAMVGLYQLIDRVEIVYERRCLQRLDAEDMEVQARLHTSSEKTMQYARPGANYIPLPLFFNRCTSGLRVDQCPKQLEVHVHVAESLPQAVIDDMQLVSRHYFSSGNSPVELPPPKPMPFTEPVVMHVPVPADAPIAGFDVDIPTQGLLTELLFGYVSNKEDSSTPDLWTSNFRGKNLVHEFFTRANLRLDGKDVYNLEDPQYYAMHLVDHHTNPQAFGNLLVPPGLYCMPFSRFPEAIDHSGELNTTPFESVQLSIQTRTNLPPGKLLVIVRTWNAITHENEHLVRCLM